MIDKNNVKLQNWLTKLRSCHNAKVTLIQKGNVSATKLNVIEKRRKKLKKCLVEENKRLINRSNISKLKSLRLKCINSISETTIDSKEYLRQTESFAFKLVKKNIISFNRARRIISSLAKVAK